MLVQFGQQSLQPLHACFMFRPPIGSRVRAGFLALSLYQAGKASQHEGVPASPFQCAKTVSLNIQTVSTSVAVQISHRTRAMCSGNIE